MRPADPIDLAVARAFNGPSPPPESIASRMVAEALGLGAFDPLTVEVAEIIFGFDQEAIEQPWRRLTEHRRQPYYNIAEAVLKHVRKRGRA